MPESPTYFSSHYDFMFCCFYMLWFKPWNSIVRMTCQKIIYDLNISSHFKIHILCNFKTHWLRPWRLVRWLIRLERNRRQNSILSLRKGSSLRLLILPIILSPRHQQNLLFYRSFQEQCYQIWQFSYYSQISMFFESQIILENNIIH